MELRKFASLFLSGVLIGFIALFVSYLFSLSFFQTYCFAAGWCLGSAYLQAKDEQELEDSKNGKTT